MILGACHRAAVAIHALVYISSGLAAAVAVDAGDRPLAMAYYEEGKKGEIVISKPDGTSMVNLTQDPRQTDNFPTWSPDGVKIAFNFHRTGGWAIWIINSDGSAPERLLQIHNRTLIPSWSPDGKRITFFGDFGGYWNLGVVDADGTHMRQLTDHKSVNRDPCQSLVSKHRSAPWLPLAISRLRDRRYSAVELGFVPGEYWRHVRVPVLTLFGDKDSVTPVAESTHILETTLPEQSSTVRYFRNVNHLLLGPTETGDLDELPRLDGFDPSLFVELRSWLAATSGAS